MVCSQRLAGCAARLGDIPWSRTIEEYSFCRRATSTKRVAVERRRRCCVPWPVASRPRAPGTNGSAPRLATSGPGIPTVPGRVRLGGRSGETRLAESFVVPVPGVAIGRVRASSRAVTGVERIRNFAQKGSSGRWSRGAGPGGVGEGGSFGPNGEGSGGLGRGPIRVVLSSSSSRNAE